MPLTAKQRKDHIRGKGCSCPYCKSHEISADSPQTGDNDITERVECLSCGKTWTDIFTVTDIIEDDDEPSGEDVANMVDEIEKKRET